MLQPDASLRGLSSRWPPDRAALPTDVELPVEAAGREIGRFLLRSSDAVISLEERRTAVALAQIFGEALASRP